MLLFFKALQVIQGFNAVSGLKWVLDVLCLVKGKRNTSTAVLEKLVDIYI